jgi:hypothetical protein
MNLDSGATDHAEAVVAGVETTLPHTCNLFSHAPC